MKHYYSNERSVQILISLLKQHKIKKIIASPGNTNVSVVASLQHDSCFEIYSSVDERSAAYIACGMAAESGEPVVLSCTGATASRNYMPGLTEAYYRQLPILVITSSQDSNRIDMGWPQVTDRRNPPQDVARISVQIPKSTSKEAELFAEMEINRALLELKLHGGGPVHINLIAEFSRDFSVTELPVAKMIRRFCPDDEFPELPHGKIAVVTGAHVEWDVKTLAAVERFCQVHDAVVFGDHTGNYTGEHGIRFSLVAGQDLYDSPNIHFDLLISIGSISGDYTMWKFKSKEVWRVNPDGKFHTLFGNLTNIFEMTEEKFFSRYSEKGVSSDDSYINACRKDLAEIEEDVPELPFSSLYAAQHLAPRIPENAVVHLGILGSLRALNFFQIPGSVRVYSNVGGFGIDGGLSSLIGASLIRPEKLFFGIIGDLAFFYDLNSLGNRHIGNNIRVLLLNNGKGMEFRHYDNIGAVLGEETDEYISAARHYGNKSPELVKHYAQDLGYEYLTASNKEEFSVALDRFVSLERTEYPMIFELFIDTANETDALFALKHIKKDMKGQAKQMVKDMLGQSGLNIVRNFKK